MRSFFSDDISSELIIKLLITAEFLDLKNFCVGVSDTEISEKKIFKYLKNTINNMYNDLVKKTLQNDIIHISYEENEHLINNSNCFDLVESNAYLKNILNSLSPKQSLVLTEIYLNGKTQHQISIEQKMSKQNVSNIHRRGLEAIKIILERESMKGK